MAAWETGRTCRPYIVIEDWDVQDVADILEGTTGLRLSDWEELARLFLERPE
jgi:hypothetical protein